MAELNRQMGFAAIERDEHFEPKSLSAVRGKMCIRDRFR